MDILKTKTLYSTDQKLSTGKVLQLCANPSNGLIEVGIKLEETQLAHHLPKMDILEIKEIYNYIVNFSELVDEDKIKGLR